MLRSLSARFVPYLPAVIVAYACAAEDPGDGEMVTDVMTQPTDSSTGSTNAPATGAPSSSDTGMPSATVPATMEPIPTLTVPPEEVPGYGEINYMINLTCANVVCHTPLYFPPDLTDSMGDQYEILTTWIVEECGNIPLVTPGDPARSAILKVTKHECGELAMPKDCTDPDCIGAEKREDLMNWIIAGASSEL